MQCSNTSGEGLGNCTYYHFANSSVYVNNSNIEFMKLGVAGHSAIVASGDDGTAGGHSSLNNCETMGPIFPATSPYVTSCGATSLEASTSFDDIDAAKQPPICTDSFYECNCSTSNNEQVANNNNTAGFDTGGGFSFYNAQPQYQQAAVQAYVKSGVTLPLSKYWNPNNRGYPDIAGLGENICVLDPGLPCSLVAGTSCAAPLVSALTTLLNNDRLNKGKSPLGFINPLLYSMFSKNPTKYFNNQFDDSNNSGECPANMGFNAKPGYWTPLTGVGSPNFGNIRQFVDALP